MASTKGEPPIGSLDQFQLALYASKGSEPPLNGTDLAVLLELIDRFKKKEGVTYPSSAGHLARETGRPIRSVQASLQRLQDIKLAIVVEHGAGTKGNTYTFNFAWVREVAAEIHAEKEARAAAKKRRRKPTYAENRVGSTDDLATRKSAPLRDIVTRKFAQLSIVPTRKSAPQTYVGPTSPYVGGAGTPTLGLTPTSGAAPREAMIVGSSIDTDTRGDKLLSLVVSTDSGMEEISICVESGNQRRQDDGQAEFKRLCRALGLDENSVGD
ncbi:hypothetical protein AB4144_29225, partial [Rhizobiaceae sp. 2RAB30]